MALFSPLSASAGLTETPPPTYSRFYRQRAVLTHDLQQYHITSRFPLGGGFVVYGDYVL